MSNRRSFLKYGAGALGASLLSSPCAAQATKQLRIVVPFPPGGATDTVARLIATKLQATYGMVLVDNRPGASGRIAMDHVKNADPHSNTVLIYTSGALSVYPFVYKKLSYTAGDFTPVTTVCDYDFALFAGPAVPAEVKTFAELARWIKADPKLRGKVALPSQGTVLHFTQSKLAQAAGLDLTGVPYKGGAPAIQDVIGGHVPLGFNQLGEIVPYAETGKVRVFGSSGATRSAVLPNVPTFREIGLDVEGLEWFGFLMPAKAPTAEVAQLNAAVRAALTTPEVKEVFRKWNFAARGESPAEFAQLIKQDYDRWGPVVKASGFTIDE